MADKTKRRRHFLREWRKHRGLTLDQAVERLRALAANEWPDAISDDRFRKRLGFTKGNLSRIENKKVPYNEDLLVLLADAYNADVASLLIRNPLDPDAPWSIWDQIPAEDRSKAMQVLQAFRKAG